MNTAWNLCSIHNSRDNSSVIPCHRFCTYTIKTRFLEKCFCIVKNTIYINEQGLGFFLNLQTCKYFSILSPQTAYRSIDKVYVQYQKQLVIVSVITFQHKKNPVARNHYDCFSRLEWNESLLILMHCLHG